MNDRELLEKAARAVGADMVWTDCDGNFYTSEPERAWQPLEDDGDAFRLMVELSLEVSVDQAFGIVEAGRESGSLTEHYDGGSYEATARRAITRAAAAIGDKL